MSNDSFPYESTTLMTALHLDPFLHLSFCHLKKQMIKSGKPPGSLDKKALKAKMLEMGLTPKIRNLAYAISTTQRPPQHVVPQISESSDEWRASIHDELVAVCEERGAEMAEAEGGKDEKKIRFIFDSEDLFDAVKRIPPSDNLNTDAHNHFGLIQVVLPTPNHLQLKEMFKEFHPSNQHYGLDENFKGSSR